MKRYVSYSKILEDTRNPESESSGSLAALGICVPILKRGQITITKKHEAIKFQGSKSKGQSIVASSPEACYRSLLSLRMGHCLGLVSCDLEFLHRRVCLAQDFHKKCWKKFKISSLCPLIISTKEDAMINNMVLSREIEWIGYEHKRNMLQVEFIVGSIYQYENVPETVYQEFLTAPSHGRFFESNIKNKYHVRKVR